MSKKKKRRQAEASGGTVKPEVSAASAPVDADPISSTGRRTIIAGLGVVALGFVVLTRADSMGRNWAASLAPLLILGGYGIVGWGIFRDDPSAPEAGGEKPDIPTPSSPSSPSEKTT